MTLYGSAYKEEQDTTRFIAFIHLIYPATSVFHLSTLTMVDLHKNYVVSNGYDESGRYVILVVSFSS
jgi:hypothetical protein